MDALLSAASAVATIKDSGCNLESNMNEDSIIESHDITWAGMQSSKPEMAAQENTVKGADCDKEYSLASTGKIISINIKQVPEKPYIISKSLNERVQLVKLTVSRDLVLDLRKLIMFQEYETEPVIQLKYQSYFGWESIKDFHVDIRDKKTYICGFLSGRLEWNSTFLTPYFQSILKEDLSAVSIIDTDIEEGTNTITWQMDGYYDPEDYRCAIMFAKYLNKKAGKVFGKIEYDNGPTFTVPAGIGITEERFRLITQEIWKAKIRIDRGLDEYAPVELWVTSRYDSIRD